MASDKRVLILGIGNLLWADEGFGVRAVQELHRRYTFPPNVTLLDGGTQGIYLVQFVQEADVLVVFDAIDYGLPAGTLKVVKDAEVPKFMGAKKMSLHQTGFQEVIALAEFTDKCPKQMLLVGVQPVELEDFGGSLRDPIRAQIEPALTIALDYLVQLDIHAQLRIEPLAPEQDLLRSELDILRYEAERPSAEEAFRLGDPRFISSEK